MGQEENTELRDKLENLEDDIQDQEVKYIYCLQRRKILIGIIIIKIIII